MEQQGEWYRADWAAVPCSAAAAAMPVVARRAAGVPPYIEGASLLPHMPPTKRLPFGHSTGRRRPPRRLR